MVIKSADGVDIPLVVYNTDENHIKGVVIISHGFGEHSRCYEELAEHFTSNHYACVVFDQRGHGSLKTVPPERRAKMLGIIPGYDSFLDDIGSIVAALKQRSPTIPVILYGHSMGGNIILNYLLRRDQSNIACAVAEAPWLGLYKKVPAPVVLFAKIAGKLSGSLAIYNKLQASDITGDPERVEGYWKDPLYHNRISLRMFAGINDGCNFAINNAAGLSIPLFIGAANHDRIVSNKAIRAFVEAGAPGLVLKEYESHHAIHNDISREEFFRDVIAFLDSYIL